MTPTDFAMWCAERRRYWHQQGKTFDPSNLASQFVPYFTTRPENRRRIKVTRTYTGPPDEVHTRTGTVGVSSGFRPIFLLMHRSNAIGSWDTLTDDDVIVGEKNGRTYTAPYVVGKVTP